MIPRVKICGVTSIEDALACCEAGADALGFNFVDEARKRGRYIEEDKARAIARELPPFIAKVAVTVNEPIERLAAMLEYMDYIQLHGEESPEVCAQLEGRAIKAFRIGPGFDLASMAEYPAAAYLVDACVPGSRGGTGIVCDWTIARTAGESGKPLILAGGLTPENVAEAVRQVRPYAIDVAGGVESAPGKKDYERSRRFVRNAKYALDE